MKKLTYIIPVILIVILSVVCVFFIVKGVGAADEVEISAYEMDYRTNGLSLGELRVRRDYVKSNGSFSFTPVSEEELKSRAKMSDFFKSEIILNNNKGYYYIKNNNAYYLYKNGQERWELENLYSSCVDELLYYYHVPGPLAIDYNVASSAEDSSSIRTFYKEMDYNFVKHFYMGFDSGFAVFDDEAQTIKIKVYDTREAGFTQKQRLIYDFVKKDIGVIGDDGSIDWVQDKLAEINSGT